MASYSERDTNWHHKKTYYDESGEEYHVFHRWNKLGRKYGTEIRKPDGEVVWTGSELTDKSAKSKLYDKLGQKSQIFTSGELQQFKADEKTKREAEEKTEGFKEEFSEALERSKQELKEVGEAGKAEAIRLTGRQSSVNQATLRDVLLAQGRDMAEVDEIIQTGAEENQRNLTSILNQGALATKESVAQMNTMEIGSIATAEELGMKQKSLADTLMLNRQQLAQSWDIANLNRQTQLDITEMQQPSWFEQLSGAVAAGGQAAQGYSAMAALV